MSDTTETEVTLRDLSKGLFGNASNRTGIADLLKSQYRPYAPASTMNLANYPSSVGSGITDLARLFASKTAQSNAENQLDLLKSIPNATPYVQQYSAFRDVTRPYSEYNQYITNRMAPISSSGGGFLGIGGNSGHPMVSQQKQDRGGK